MILSKEQRQVVESPEDKIVVMSAAASGKTRILIERIRWVLKNGCDPSKMVCITFTNNAAAEIKLRLGDDYKDGMYIGTVHGYANNLLTRAGVQTRSFIRAEEFDELFNLIIDHPQVIEEVDFLALDEAQDSSSAQFDFIFNMIKPKTFLVVGDIRQSIYGFNDANPKLILSLSKDDDVTTYSMVQNHRNSIEVIKYSNWILNKMKKIPVEEVIGQRNDSGVVETIRLSQIVNLLKEPYGDWVILCRYNRTISRILGILASEGIPAITFRQAQQGLEDLQKKINSNAVKVLTIHSSKGLEFNNVIVAEQAWRSEENLRLMYVAATRAKNELYWVKGK